MNVYILYKYFLFYVCKTNYLLFSHIQNVNSIFSLCVFPWFPLECFFLFFINSLQIFVIAIYNLFFTVIKHYILILASYFIFTMRLVSTLKIRLFGFHKHFL